MWRPAHRADPRQGGGGGCRCATSSGRAPRPCHGIRGPGGRDRSLGLDVRRHEVVTCRALPGGLPVAVVLAFLLWNREASAWFDRGHGKALAASLGGAGWGGPASSGARRVDFLLRLTVLGATIALTPGITVSRPASLLVAVVAISLAGWLLQPVFVRIALLFGWFGACTPGSSPRWPATPASASSSCRR